jgi:hypothetical protein
VVICATYYNNYYNNYSSKSGGFELSRAWRGHIYRFCSRDGLGFFDALSLIRIITIISHGALSFDLGNTSTP